MAPKLEKGEIDKILTEKIEKNIGEEKEFKNEKVKRWSDNIIRECLRELVKLQKPYKFIVTCIINQRCGNGLYQYVSCFSDPMKDIITTMHWKNDIIHCIVSVYALPVL